MAHRVTNFGGNIRFTPRHYYAPTTEAEVLAILDRHARGKIRVVGARHAWSAGIVSHDALVDLRHFDSVRFENDHVTVGGGCRIKHLLRKLHRDSDFTLPSIGLITEQSVAGAISTATHGSGKHSLSHYVAEVRVAAYDPDTGKARIYAWNGGDKSRAARCAVGCLGIVLSVRFRCVPRYDVAEKAVECASLDEVLAGEAEYPLQQFYLLPWRWTYLVQRRRSNPAIQPRGSRAVLYRAYWYLAIDLGLHVAIKLLASFLRSRSLTKFFYRHVLTRLVVKNVAVTDRAEQMLVMEHELFRHMEIEIFVPARHMSRAAAFVRSVVEWFDGVGEKPEGVEAGDVRGTFTQHYPITFRRVLPDDAMIAMTADAGEPYYAISFITYVEPRGPFLAMARVLAESMTRLFEARLHWGKYYPLDGRAVAGVYPQLHEFRNLCRRVDPEGVFRNGFTDSVLFG